MILFGVRSPLAVEYEEACLRAAVPVSVCVSVSGTPRVLTLEDVVDLDEFVPDSGDSGFLACAFAPQRREELTELARSRGLVPAHPLIHPAAIVATSVRIGEGSFVNAGVVIGAASILGASVLVNRSSSLGHHTLLGDFVSIGPGATLAGNVHVGSGSMIGAGSVILPDVRIGCRAVIAAGSVVRHPVPDDAMVAGNPAVERAYDSSRGSLNVEGGE